jgi:CxxC-x17-CxxC domain-containing protein
MEDSMRRMDNQNNRGRSNFRSNNSFGRSNNQERIMHKAICSKCKKECEVPFKPKEDRPVFCRECYMKQDN